MTATVKEYLERQKQQKLDASAELAKQAELKGEDATAEKAQINKLLDDVESINVQIKSIDDAEDLRSRIDSIRGPVAPAIEEAGGSKSDSIGQAFIKSEGYKAVREAGFQGSKWTTGSIEMPDWNGGQKATVSESASAVVQPDVQPGILPILNWPLTIADLFAPGTTTSNTVRFIEEATNVNAAAGTAEAAAFPESTITFDQKDMPVGKVTTFLPVTDEMLEDVDQAQSYLDNRLGMFVKIKEDSDLLNASGTPSVTGVLQNGSIQTGSALSLDTDSALDAILQAMTLVKTGSFLDADAVVVHPTDWVALKLMKDGNKQYYGGGPFTGAYGGSGGIAGKSVWDLPVVVTTAIAAGTALVGAFRQGGQIFRRRGLTIEASNSHQDFFQKDLTAIRASERLALVIYRPSAFYKLTGINQLEGS